MLRNLTQVNINCWHFDKFHTSLEIKVVEEADQDVIKFQKIVRRGQGGLYFEEYLV